MYFFLPLLAGCIIGIARHGSIWSISRIKLKWLLILPIAYVVQFLAIYYMLGFQYEFAIITSYIMLILFCLYNRKVPGVMWALFGIVLNFIVLVANHLRMPAYLPSVSEIDPQSVSLLKQGAIEKSVAMTANTHLNFLGDIFAIRIGKGGIISIGDILINIGIIVLIQYAMRIERATTINGDTK